ncbi:hypothetical protein CQJ94_02965 [Glycomyces fuscus]|nr:hypothetical protein CQJ94_02965 [Glycomyces fuscus]
MSTVDDLVRLLYPEGPPPPVGDGPPDFPLPSDVRELLTRVGSGFEVDNRFHFTVDGGTPERSRIWWRNLRQVYGRDEITIAGNVGSHREEDGDYRIVFSDLLFVGSDDNGANLYWEAVGDPDGWALLADSGCLWTRHEMSTVDYLYGLLSGSFRCPAFTLRDWPEAVLDVVPSA